MRAMPTSQGQIRDIRVRVATPEDVDLLCTLGRETYREHFASIWSAAALAAFLEREFARIQIASELATTHVRYFVAEATPTSELGFAKVRASAATDTDAELHKIYLRSAALGHGVGRQLLVACEAYARDQGFRQLRLDVLERNASGVAFYRHHGFAMTDRKSLDTGLAIEAMVTMVKRLI